MRQIALAATIFLQVSSYDALAQTFDINELNYGFANYLGTGIYKVADREVQIYQIPFSYEFDQTDNDVWKITLTAPLTIGFYDFKSSDFLDDNLPDSVSTYSFVPGIEALYPVKTNWLLGAFIDAGYVENRELNEINKIYGAGLISNYKLPFDNTILTVANRFLYTKDTGSNIEHADDYASFETNLDLRFPSTFKQRSYVIDFSIYYANYRYFDNLDFLRPAKRPVEVGIQHELGFTFGLKQAVKYKYLTIPRLGIGYRFGDDLSIIRFVIATDF